MPTNTAGVQARHLPWNVTAPLVKKVVFGDNGTQLSMGYLAAGTIVLRAYAVVKTVFNGDGASVLDIGISGTVDAFATNIDIKSSVGVLVDTQLATATGAVLTSDTEIVCRWDSADATNLTTGLAYAVVEFITEPAVVDA